MQILATLSFTGVKAPVNHESAPEFALLRMAAVVDVAVFSYFAQLHYPPHFLNGGYVSSAFYEGIRQLGRGTIPFESPAVTDAHP